MSDLTIPPLLAHTPEVSPPRRAGILILPAILAVLGILIATAAAISGQDARRNRDYSNLDKSLYHAQYQLAEAQLNHADPDKIADLSAHLQALKVRQIPSYSRPGRQFAEWDGYRYEDIAERGYFYRPPPSAGQSPPPSPAPTTTEPRRNNVVWYPLYPMLGWLLAKTTGLPVVTALTVISEISAILAAMIFFLYARRHYYNRMPRLLIPGDRRLSPAELHPSRRWDLAPQDSAALWAVAALFFGPCAIFLYANYTESLFVLLLAAFLFCLQSRWWWRAAAIAAVAGACRSQGVLFAPILALVFILRSDVRRFPAKIALAAALFIVSALGIGAYMLYLQHNFGDPLAFVHAQIAWNVGINAASFYHAINPVNAMTNLVHRAFFNGEMDWPRVWEAFCVIWPPIMLLVLGGRFLSFELELVGWLLWGLPFISNSLAGSTLGASPWMSMGRFMAVLIPAHIIIGAVILRFRWLGIPFLAASAAAFGVFAYLFGTGVWVG